MLDDKDNSVKIQALNALKAFSGIRKFRLKIQVSLGRVRRMFPGPGSFDLRRVNDLVS